MDVQRNTESYKPSEITREAGYHTKVERSGLDELRMRGLVGVERSRAMLGSSVSGRVCEIVFVWSV